MIIYGPYSYSSSGSQANLGMQYMSGNLAASSSTPGGATTSTNYSAYTNSTPIAHLSGTGNAIYSLDQGIMANNANYQNGINNNQTNFMNTANSEAQALGSQIGQQGKKSGKGK